MICSRICLNPLADDCHLDSTLTKLEIKTLGDSLVKKTLKNKCGLLTCVRHALWARRVAIAEWSAHSLLSSFLQESLFDLSFLVSHLLFTRWWLVPSRSRVVQFPSFLTVQLSTGLEFFFGGQGQLCYLSIPHISTPKKMKKETRFWNLPEQEKKKSWRRYFATFKISILFCPTNEQSQDSLLSRNLSISLARVLRKDFYFFYFLFPLAWAWVEFRREILKRFWDLCVCVCVCVFSCAIGVDSSSSCSCVQRFGLLLSSA